MKVSSSNKKTIKAYNKIASSYRSINYERDFWLDEFEFFKTLLSGKKVLDIGCGSGRDAVLFTEKGFNYLGIDASDAMLKIARKVEPRAKFIKADIYNLKSIGGNFDGYWAAASLLHIPKKDIVNILVSLRSTIKKNGAGFIALKPKKDISEETVLDKRYGNSSRFFSYYSVPEFRKILSDSGFRVVKISKKIEPIEKKIWLCFFVKIN